ncbi:short transient receptor potential channel 6-like, partial [Limulus polyphemus]|uniref:Short transient receptor potential channel 6-like n=1 Tax=Limulus polyphemus TaxID=6850 RepID=A0ABM1BSE5_LIMPO
KSSKEQHIPIQHRIATFCRDRSLLNKLQITETEFFKVVESGDVSQVQKFLEETPKVDLNSTNYQGLTALDIAVKAENISVISILLERESLVIGDAVHHAVSTGNYDIIRLLLDTLRAQEPSISDYTYSSEFSERVNPLMLAAQQGSYHLIRLLIERGHYIRRPHIPSCLCKACKRAVKDQSHDLTVFRLNVYLAISNPAYICLTSDDPILTAFELDDELKLCAQMNEEYRDEYEKMALDARKFAFDLLSNCRTLFEVNLVLQQTDGIENVGRLKYPRLQLAVDYKQKS